MRASSFTARSGSAGRVTAMSDVTLTFDGLDEFKAKLTAVSNEYAATAEKHLTRAGNKLKKLARENTPDSGYEHKSKLKKSWKSEVVGTKGENLEYQLRNTAPHYHLVERGHEEIVHGKHIGFVQGRHFFAKSVQEFEASGVYAQELEKYMKDVKKKLGD